jgi:hypothetical protein
VTKRALMQRVNRALKADGEQLKVSRGMRAFLDLGELFTVDISRNFISRKDIDLERLARQLGVLKPYETLEPIQ